jgi:hypothetical protein
LIADAGLRRCDGDAVMSRMEDLNVKVCEKAVTWKIVIAREGGKAFPTIS